ncbi:MAG TPA: AtpZ/AtpI family protein, partial [Candidatus Desulfofervidus auxilii]|nr:AtpZ/AtpI family protein [Candidatus Desulfofervidus auxilii]
MLKELKEFFADFSKVVAYATQIGLAIALSIVIGLVIGYYLDKWLRVNWPFPHFLIVLFLIFGVIAGFRNIFIIMKR